MEEEISLLELLGIVRKRLGLIVVSTLAGILIFAVYTFFIAVPQYSSTTQMLVNRAQETTLIQRSDIDTNVQLINTYKDILKNPAILTEVKEELDLGISHQELSNQLTVTSEIDSQVFTIKITDTNPYKAADIANTTASVFQENLDDIMNVDNVSVIYQAEANLDPVSPNHLLNLVIGTIVGGLLGTVMVFVIEFTDNTVKDDKFINDKLGWINLGSVSEMTADELKQDEQEKSPDRLIESQSSRSRV
ncbi:Capsular polysaccharide biosynthesis protein [Alkalibacterium subtropicum]|uniref:Capsular polysaccharide biosynthesis protein CpsC n=1 Tax=Alkalibacterium subtropicum TaxID=753702 RepID=A0A1I1GDY6_9LACT|nr:Wzz/FepE/Etk N-terminal domain-containing protein [Alkalibacterium subtropicum]SFC09949.1 Capsular polysaccharide biosynthesis protein [Alkalibacterium subtropicum]